MLDFRALFSNNVFTRAQVDVLKRLYDSKWKTLQYFGGCSDGVSDNSMAFRAAGEYAKKHGGLTLFLPAGDYRLVKSTPITSVSGGCCVPFDGVSNLRIVGERGARLLMKGDTGRVNFITFWVSAASQAAGRYSQRNSIENVEFALTRAAGFSDNISTILLHGTEDCAIINCRIDHSLALGSTFGISGAGRRNRFIDNELIGVATCFDQTYNEDCTYRGNSMRGLSNAVTGFNHFYDPNSTADMRWQYAISQVLGSGNLFEDNEIIGYGAGFSIRGMRDSWIQRNRIHDFTANDTTTRNMISLYSEDNDGSVTEVVRNMIIRDNLIYDVGNSSTGTTRGIFINQSVGELAVHNVLISGNIIHDISGTGAVGISWTGTTNNFRLDANLVDAASVNTPYGFANIGIMSPSGSGLSPTIKVDGTADLILEPGSGRYVRFGVREVRSDTAVTHSFPMRMADGTTVHVALVAAP